MTTWETWTATALDAIAAEAVVDFLGISDLGEGGPVDLEFEAGCQMRRALMKLAAETDRYLDGFEWRESPVNSTTLTEHILEALAVPLGHDARMPLARVRALCEDLR